MHNMKVLTGAVYGASPFNPASLGTLLAEYDMLQGANAAILYDRSTNAAHGVSTGCTYSAYGCAPSSNAANYIKTGVPWSAVRTVVAYIQQARYNTVASVTANGVGTPLYGQIKAADPLTIGNLYPSLAGLFSGAGIQGDISASVWPYSLAWTFPTGGNVEMYVSKTRATVVDAASPTADFALGSITENVSFGNNFVSTGNDAQATCCYMLLFSSALNAATIAKVHDYMVAQCAGRSIPIGGPAAFTTNLLAFTGNSLTNGMNVASITPTGTWDRVKSSFVGGTPAQVIEKAVQAIVPLRRPLASKNYVQLWPSPNGSAAESFANAQTFCDLVRPLGWKVSLVTAISADAYDATKNALNAMYDGATYGSGPGTLADVLCDLRSVPEASADNAYANATNFPDGLHPSATLYALLYPVMASAFNAIP